MNFNELLVLVEESIKDKNIKIGLIAKEVTKAYNSGNITDVEKEEIGLKVHNLIDSLNILDSYKRRSKERYSENLNFFNRDRLLDYLNFSKCIVVTPYLFEALNDLYGQDKGIIELVHIKGKSYRRVNKSENAHLKKNLCILKRGLDKHSKIFIDKEGYKNNIDIEIYDLIVHLNNLGLETEYSCSGHYRGTSYIDIKGEYNVSNPNINLEHKILNNIDMNGNKTPYTVTRLYSNPLVNVSQQEWMGELMRFRKEVLSLKSDDFILIEKEK